MGSNEAEMLEKLHPEVEIIFIVSMSAPAACAAGLLFTTLQCSRLLFSTVLGAIPPPLTQ